MVERSVMFQPDGTFVEYNKSALLIRNVQTMEQGQIERQIEEVNLVPIAVRSEAIVQQEAIDPIIVTQAQDMGWSSFLIIFALLIVALYSIKVLIKRVKQFRRDFKEHDGLGSTNRQSLLADMDDEWRMQKIENEAPTKRTTGNFDGDYEKVVEQQWPTYSIGQRKEKLGGSNSLAKSRKGSQRYEDDEFKRS